uniref:FXYD domain-containing ion transport regulator n=1 Tax=Cyprinus carpio TaxID=7962 RepID=A0A8C2F7Q4_CYPCA
MDGGNSVVKVTVEHVTLTPNCSRGFLWKSALDIEFKYLLRIGGLAFAVVLFALGVLLILTKLSCRTIDNNHTAVVLFN